MVAETIEKIFDPFFTTKFTGRRLGMSTVLGIVRGHKGALKIRTEVGRARRSQSFSMRLNRPKTASRAERSTSSRERLARKMFCASSAPRSLRCDAGEEGLCPHRPSRQRNEVNVCIRSSIRQ